jgi:hypothetical protein
MVEGKGRKKESRAWKSYMRKIDKRGEEKGNREERK